jgi:DNA ligase-1
MDLSKFTNNKEKTKRKKVFEDDNLIIYDLGDKEEYFFKNKKGLIQVQDNLFFSLTNSKIVNNEKELKDFFQESIDRGVEGVMLKNLNSTYNSGLRVGSMVKIKETKENLDVVILGAEMGKGKRAGFYSSFLIGVLNDKFIDDEKFLIVGKVSSGIKEVDENSNITLKNLTELLKPLKIKEENGISWFEPKIIIEIKYQELQKSPKYNSGYALRFPRIISLREDKSIDEMNTISDLEKFL